MQEYASNLGELVDIVVSHQGLPLKVSLIKQLLEALVLPVPDHYQSHLRRMANLGAPLPPARKLPWLRCAAPAACSCGGITSACACLSDCISRAPAGQGCMQGRACMQVVRACSSCAR